MSAGNGSEPTGPHVEQAVEDVQVAIEKKIVFQSRLTEVLKQADGSVVFSHVVIDAGQPVEMAFVASPDEAKAILQELAGGLVIP